MKGGAHVTETGRGFITEERVEAVSGKKLGAVLKESLFEPLGMHIGGVYLTQVLPFADKKSLPLCGEFETTVYRYAA